jgi:hypothetical protein
MNMRFKNWSRFQHYKRRTPPWIKLHRTLLDDKDYHSMSPLSAKLLPLAWLLASEYDGALPDIEIMAFRFRITIKDVQRALIEWKPYVEDIASVVLASCKQNAPLETETETEKSREDTIASSDESLLAENVFTEIPCTGKEKTVHIFKTYIVEMKKLYPGVDIEKETLRAKAWCINNPTKRKTTSGVCKFLGSWYAKAQNNSGNGKPAQESIFDKMMLEASDDIQS